MSKNWLILIIVLMLGGVVVFYGIFLTDDVSGHENFTMGMLEKKILPKVNESNRSIQSDNPNITIKGKAIIINLVEYEDRQNYPDWHYELSATFYRINDRINNTSGGTMDDVFIKNSTYDKVTNTTNISNEYDWSYFKAKENMTFFVVADSKYVPYQNVTIIGIGSRNAELSYKESKIFVVYWPENKIIGKYTLKKYPESPNATNLAPSRSGLVEWIRSLPGYTELYGDVYSFELV